PDGAGGNQKPSAEVGLLGGVVITQIDSGAVNYARITAGLERGAMIKGPVAIFAADRDGVAHFPVQLAVAVRVAFEVAIGALHPQFLMDVLQFDRPPPRLLHAGGND